jgi:hypothetical protein
LHAWKLVGVVFNFFRSDLIMKISELSAWIKVTLSLSSVFL